MTHRDSRGRAVPCCAGRPLMLLWIVTEAARFCLIVHHLAFFSFYCCKFLLLIGFNNYFYMIVRNNM